MSMMTQSKAERILIAVDDSLPSAWAVVFGRTIAAAINARVRLINVVEPALPIAVDFNSVEEVDTVCRQDGQTVLQRDRWLFPCNAEVETIQRVGSPSGEITQEAANWGADLIIVGTHGSHFLMEFMTVSTSNEVIRKAACPVITVAKQPCVKQSWPLKRLLVAVDGSDHSKMTLRAAADLAHLLGAEVVLLNIFSSKYDPDAEPVFSELEERAHLATTAAAAMEQLRLRVMPDLKVDIRLTEGDPASKIVQMATTCHADLVVVGTQARGLVGRTIFGSIANAVVRDSPCPVMTVAHD